MDTQEIVTLTEAATAAAQTLEDLREREAVRHAEEVLKVAFETNDAGKPLYPNEAAREAAIRVRLSATVSYLDLVERRQEAERDKALAQARLEACREALKLRRAELLARVESL